MSQDQFEFNLKIEDDGRAVLRVETPSFEQMKVVIIRLADFFTPGAPPTPATQLNLKAGQPEELCNG